jgi:hypothetical protein
MTKIINDIKIQESFVRFSSEVQNQAFARAYLAVKDLINQKEYCKRLEINETRFSRVLTKFENHATM